MNKTNNLVINKRHFYLYVKSSHTNMQTGSSGLIPSCFGYQNTRKKIHKTVCILLRVMTNISCSLVYILYQKQASSPKPNNRSHIAHV